MDQVLGSRIEMNFEDLTKLSYTGCVYKETLRLWPPIPEIARRVDQNFEVNSFDIPIDSWLQVSTYVSARQDNYFPNSEKFLPERFLINNKTDENQPSNLNE